MKSIIQQLSDLRDDLNHKSQELSARIEVLEQVIGVGDSAQIEIDPIPAREMAERLAPLSNGHDAV